MQKVILCERFGWEPDVIERMDMNEYKEWLEILRGLDAGREAVRQRHERARRARGR